MDWGWIGDAPRSYRTMYMSLLYVLEFYRESAAAGKITPDVEIIFVDDGFAGRKCSSRSSRCSTATLCSQAIQLSRNFGHHKAMMTGLAHATGFRLLDRLRLEEDPVRAVL